MRVLFCIENFKHGGIPMALNSLLSQMRVDDGITKDVFCLNQEDGPFKPLLEKYVVNKPNWWIWAFSTYYTQHHGLKKWALIGVKLIRKVMQRLGHDPLQAQMRKEVGWITEAGYDAVVAYAEGAITHLVAQVECRRKVAWIHIDYKRNLTYIDNADESRVYDRFDKIVIPSKFSLSSFKEVFPYLSDRTVAIQNIIDEGRILRLAKEPVDDIATEKDEHLLVSIGRICYEKQFFEIPRVAAALREKGIRFKWLIIGGGSQVETQMVRDKIKEHGVERIVKMMGAKDNPYPYLRMSSLLVVTSISETFSYAIAEAKVLGVPVATTPFGTVHEVLDVPMGGVIADLDSMAEAIAALLCDGQRLGACKRYLAAGRVAGVNKENIKKIEGLFV